jgi:hypothetical protein
MNVWRLHEEFIIEHVSILYKTFCSVKYGDDVKILSSSVNPLVEPTLLTTFCNSILRRIFKNKVGGGGGVTLGRRIVHSEEQRDFCSSQNNIWVIKCRKYYGRQYGTYCSHLIPYNFS